VEENRNLFILNHCFIATSVAPVFLSSWLNVYIFQHKNNTNFLIIGVFLLLLAYLLFHIIQNTKSFTSVTVFGDSEYTIPPNLPKKYIFTLFLYALPIFNDNFAIASIILILTDSFFYYKTSSLLVFTKYNFFKINVNIKETQETREFLLITKQKRIVANIGLPLIQIGESVFLLDSIYSQNIELFKNSIQQANSEIEKAAAKNLSQENQPKEHNNREK
jgi:hypothetical protein